MMRSLETIYALCKRELLRFSRERSALYASLARPVLWLIFLGSGMHNAFRAQTGVSYAAYLLPGIVAMTVLFSGLFAGVSTVWDREFGFLKEVLIAPVSRLSIVLGKVLAGTLTTGLQALLTLLFSPLVGVPVRWAGLLPTLAIVFVTSASVVGLALCIAARLKTFEGFSNLANLVALPLFFLSGSMYPVNDAPSWLQALIRLNPITYAVDALRQVLIGVGQHGMALNLAVICGFACLTVGTAAWSFKRAY
ncbi:MAG: ABC transporter permease [Myxococcales bacterium]